jgi:hypothetical protein
MPLVQRIHEVLMSEMSSAGVYLLRLVLAAVLGGAIGLEREIKHRPAGLRTNLFICWEPPCTLIRRVGSDTWATNSHRPRSFPASDSLGQVPSCTIEAAW